MIFNTTPLLMVCAAKSSSFFLQSIPTVFQQNSFNKQIDQFARNQYNFIHKLLTATKYKQ